MTTLSRNVETYGETLKYFLLDLGDCIRYRLLKHTSEPEAARLTVTNPESLQQQNMVQLKTLLDVGLREGVFGHKRRTPRIQAQTQSRILNQQSSIYVVFLRPCFKSVPRLRWRSSVNCKMLLDLIFTSKNISGLAETEATMGDRRDQPNSGSLAINMRIEFSADQLPDQALLLTCSSHEDRCKGFLTRLEGWRPAKAVIFHYDDANPKREANHSLMETVLRDLRVETHVLQFTEHNAVKSIHDNLATLRSMLAPHSPKPVVLDISVFTKRRLSHDA